MIFKGGERQKKEKKASSITNYSAATDICHTNRKRT